MCVCLCVTVNILLVLRRQEERIMDEAMVDFSCHAEAAALNVRRCPVVQNVRFPSERTWVLITELH